MIADYYYLDMALPIVRIMELRKTGEYPFLEKLDYKTIISHIQESAKFNYSIQGTDDAIRTGIMLPYILCIRHNFVHKVSQRLKDTLKKL